jgi:hypothetical protein
MTVDASTDDDWRLRVRIDDSQAAYSVHELTDRVRRPGVVKDVEGSVPQGVVVTHDGVLLYAYAADAAALQTARSAIEGVLKADGIKASVLVSRWDDELDDWRQIDPPLSAQQDEQSTAKHDAEQIETRTLVATSGRTIRREFEQTMNSWAEKVGVECKIIEQPHLLTTQVAFTVTGPKYKVDEFSRGLTAEELATVRTETGVMLSPL